MTKLSSFWTTCILVSIVICSWLLFPISTWGSKSIWCILPLLILTLQIILTFKLKQRNLLWLVLLNPVVSLVLFNTINASLKYLSSRPTIIQTCCCAGWVAPAELDKKKLIYREFFDDDCGDWAGSYYYTLDINNNVTEGLIDLFGNPIRSANKINPKK